MSPHAANIVRVLDAPSSAKASGPEDIDGGWSHSVNLGPFSNIASRHFRKSSASRVGHGNGIAPEVRREARRLYFGGAEMLGGAAS